MTHVDNDQPLPNENDVAMQRQLSTRLRIQWIIASVLVVAVVVLITLIAVHAATRKTTSASLNDSGASLPISNATAATNFQLARLGGGSTVNLKTVITGHPTVVNFFASWCTACAAELDAFGAVSNKDISTAVFVGIDTNDFDHHQASVMLQNAHISYPVGIDNSNLAVATAYRVGDLPTTVFINAAGKIVDVVLGKQSAAALSARVATLVAGGVPH